MVFRILKIKNRVLSYCTNFVPITIEGGAIPPTPKSPYYYWGGGVLLHQQFLWLSNFIVLRYFMVFIDSKHLKTIWIYIQASKLPIFMKNQWDIQVEILVEKHPPSIGIGTFWCWCKNTPLNSNRLEKNCFVNNFYIYSKCIQCNMIWSSIESFIFWPNFSFLLSTKFVKFKIEFCWCKTTSPIKAIGLT